MLAEVKYCYRCGRHVKKGGTKCWYCEAPTSREIRPPRRCVYCDEPIRPKAIKCHNCGEFLDQRSHGQSDRPVEAAETSIVIDQTVDQTIDQHMVEHQPPIGIEEQPREAQSLPSSEVDESRRIEGRTASGGGDRSVDPNAPAVRDASGSQLAPAAPSKEVVYKGASPSSLLPALAKAMGRGAMKVAKLASGSKKDDSVVDADESHDGDRYRICTICTTEILREDSYCYHCGQIYNTDKVKLQAPRDLRSNWGFYFVIALCNGVQWLLGSGPMSTNTSFLENVALATATLGPAVALLCFFRKRDFLNQALSIGLLIVSLIVMYLYGPLFKP